MTIVSATPVYGIVFALPHMLDKIGITSFWAVVFHHCLASWLSTQFVFNFVATQWTHPGSAKLAKPDREVTGQFEMACSSEFEDAQKLHYAPNWCQKCHHWKPPRSHHCGQCGICTLRMDHHCPFTGTCIGLKNHGHFLLFYSFAVIGLAYSAVLCTLALTSNGHLSAWRSQINKSMPDSALAIDRHLVSGLAGLMVRIVIEILHKKGLEILVMSIMTVVAFIFVIAMGVPAWQLALQNTTTMERLFPMKEYVEIKDQVYCPLGPGFYSQGWKQNLKDVLGPLWWKRLLIPSREGPDLRIGVSPSASKVGEEALCARVKQVREHGVEKQVATCQELGFDPGPGKETANTV